MIVTVDKLRDPVCTYVVRYACRFDRATGIYLVSTPYGTSNKLLVKTHPSQVCCAGTFIIPTVSYTYEYVLSYVPTYRYIF